MILDAQTMKLMDDEHLVASARAMFDSLTATDLEVELLKRFERLANVIPLAAELEAHDLQAEDVVKLLDDTVDSVEVTRKLLDVLREHDIDDPEMLRKRLAAVQRMADLVEEFD